jgi:hypothetical protein
MSVNFTRLEIRRHPSTEIEKTKRAFQTLKPSSNQVQTKFKPSSNQVQPRLKLGKLTKNGNKGNVKKKKKRKKGSLNNPRVARAITITIK